MQLFIKSYLSLENSSDFAILIPEKLDTINAAVFFTRAGKIEVVEEQFLAYDVYIEHKKFLLVESGSGVFDLLARMKELKEKKINKFLFVNKAYRLDDKKTIDDIFLIKKSTLYSSGKSVGMETELMKSMQKQTSVKAGKNLSIDIDSFFFKKNIITKKKEFAGFNTLSISDYYFLKFIKQNKLSGAAINYISGNTFQEKAHDDKKHFDEAMNLVVEFLKNS